LSLCVGKISNVNRLLFSQRSIRSRKTRGDQLGKGILDLEVLGLLRPVLSRCGSPVILKLIRWYTTSLILQSVGSVRQTA